MRDCIDRRTGSEPATLCDDANRAWRRAHDRPTWLAARDAALAVVIYWNKVNPTRAAEWSQQAAECHRRAQQAGGAP